MVILKNMGAIWTVDNSLVGHIKVPTNLKLERKRSVLTKQFLGCIKKLSNIKMIGSSSITYHITSLFWSMSVMRLRTILA